MNFSLTLLAACTAAINVGIISDTHFNTAYNPNSSTDLCTGIEVSGEVVAPLGRLYCDSGEKLIDVMFTHFRDTFGDVDFILVPGDSVAHRVAAPNGGPDTDSIHYDAVKENLKATFAKFKEYFPNTMILPTIGNNDGRFKDSAIDATNRIDYDELLFDLWFTELPGNAGLDLQ
jgi:hypothetical protein